jgi:LPXTG-site transpeptidase (sortase) family protein
VTVLAVAAATAVWTSVSLLQQSGADDGRGQVVGFSRPDRPVGPTPADRRGSRTTGPAASAAAATVPFPDSARLPTLGVDARVTPTGVTARGNAEIPRDGDVLGWYEYGSRPGDERGTAVLIGHRDTKAEGPGALFDLDAVQPGDRVLVTAGGRTLRYEVAALRSLDKGALPESLFRRTGSPRLVLITCGGPYIPELGGYQENLVAVAWPVTDGGTR